MGADWPGWRGPGAQGLSSDTGLPVSWGEGRNVVWKARLAGTGTSSPIVVGDLVVVTSQVGSYASDREGAPRLARDEGALAAQENAIKKADGPLGLVVEAFGRVDGKLAWTFRMALEGERPESHEKHNLATPTPVSDGKRVYAWFGNGQLVALDMAGRLVWKRNLAVEEGSFLNLWGHGSSPVVFGETLILLCDHRAAAYLLAVDLGTGKTRWKVDRGRGRVSHSTPVVAGGALIVNSDQRVDAYDPATGKLLWFMGSERQTPIPSAVFQDGTIYLSRGYRNSDVLAMRPGGEVKWRVPNGASYVPSVLVYQGLVYMTNEVGVVSCVEAATGKLVWKERLGGIFFASPVAGDGKVYLQSETGEVFVLKAGRRAEVLARNSLPERFLASPAIAGSRIFLRGDQELYGVGK